MAKMGHSLADGSENERNCGTTDWNLEIWEYNKKTLSDGIHQHFSELKTQIQLVLIF